MSDLWQQTNSPSTLDVHASAAAVGAPDLWSQALLHLRTTTRRSVVDSWFEKMAVLRSTDAAVHLSVPDDHFRDYIEAHHLDAIRECLRVVDALQHYEQFGEVCPMDWEKGEKAPGDGRALQRWLRMISEM